MEQVTSWEANQEIPRIWLNPKIHYHIYKCPPLVPVSSQINLIPAPPFQFLRSNLILSSHLRIGIPSGLFPSGFLTKTLYTPLISPVSATCPNHHIIPDLITRIEFSEEYRSLSSLLCSLLYMSDTTSLLGPNILISTLFSDTSTYLTHWGRVKQICVFTLQLCKTDDANRRL